MSMSETATAIIRRQEAGLIAMQPFRLAVLRAQITIEALTWLHVRSRVEGWDRRRLKRELRKGVRSRYAKAA
jgi:hypothetical protein